MVDTAEKQVEKLDAHARAGGNAEGRQQGPGQQGPVRAVDVQPMPAGAPLAEWIRQPGVKKWRSKGSQGEQQQRGMLVKYHPQRAKLDATDRLQGAGVPA